VILSCLFLLAATSGTFRGQVVSGPELDAGKKWIYVQASKGAVRRVEVSQAKVAFAPELKASPRRAKPQDALREGAQVRVTASQDSDGEWKATAVEILMPAPR
jgi:hypothetical protein